jgi:hypothetical protein
VQWKESLHSSRKEKRRLQYYLQRVWSNFESSDTNFVCKLLDYLNVL